MTPECAFSALLLSELVDKWLEPFLADGKPLIGRGAVDLSLNREDRVNAACPFDGERGASRRSADSKNLRRPWRQQTASVVGPDLRFA